MVVCGIERANDPAQRASSGFYDAALAVTEFRRGKPSVVRIHPITTIVDRPTAFGASRIATGEDATRIVDRIRKESARFGIGIRNENGVGVTISPTGNDGSDHATT